jgi:glycosyltransferase involved in cell wall biosynthesis
MSGHDGAISVVIPAYNAREFIRDAIASVHAQTVRAREVIVVDDGSSDGTGRLAGLAGARVVRLLNSGPAEARNAGIKAASGHWIAFLDADDTWDSEKLEQQVDLARSFRKAAVISCDRRTTRGGRVIERSYFATVAAYPRLARTRALAAHNFFGGVTSDFLTSGCVLLPSTLLVRRSVFESVGLFARQLRAYEDYEFLLRALARHPLGIVEQPLVTYRLHRGNLHDDREVMWINAKRLERLVRANPSQYPPGALETLAWVAYLPPVG